MKKLYVLIFFIVSLWGNEKVVLQLRWLHQFQFAGYYAAVEKGFYRDVGLDVELREANVNRRQSEKEVIEGRAQFGIGNAGIVYERINGKPLVVLASIFQRSPNIWIMKKESQIQDIVALSQKRLMMTKSPENLELLLMFYNEGIALNKLNIIENSYDINDLLTRKVDAFNGYISNEPYLLRQKKIPYTIIDPHNYGIDFYSDTLFTTEEMIQNSPDVVKRFREASLKGWSYALSHKEEIVELIIQKYSKRLTKDHLLYEARMIHDLMSPELIEIGHSNLNRWKYIADTFVALKMAKPHYSLEGFLYTDKPQIDYKKIYTIVGLLLIALLITLIFIYQQNRFTQRLRKEIESKEHIEKELALHNAIFKDVLDTVDMPIYAVKPETYEIIFANYFAKEYFKADSRVPCYVMNCGSTPCADCPLAHKNQIYEGFERTHDFMKNGHFYQSRIKIIRWFDQSLVLVAVVMDMTEQKEKEESLLFHTQRLTQQAQEGEELIQMIFSSVNLGIVICDDEGVIVRYNQQFSDLVQAHHEDIHSLYDFLPSQCQTDDHKFTKECLLQCANGETLPVQITAAKLNHKSYMVLTFTNIQEMKQLQQERLDSEKLLVHQSRMATMGEMIQLITHQWKQPLNLLAIHTRTLEDEYYDHASPELFSQISQKNLELIQFMGRTIDDFKNFFKPEKKSSIFSASHALKEILSLIQPIFDKKNIAIIIDNSSDLFDTIEGYPNEFKHVLLNILNNAREAMENTPEKNIFIHFHNKENFLEINIEDTGGGIPLDILTHLFEPYMTTKGEQGTGVGLYMSKGIIQKMNGTLHATNTDKGACFILQIPLSMRHERIQ